MSPYAAFQSYETFFWNDSGVPSVGGVNKYDEFTIPLDCYAFGYFTSAFLTGGPITVSVINKAIPEMKLTCSGTSAAFQVGTIRGSIFFRPGDVVQWQYSTSDGGASASLQFTLVLMRAK